MRHRNRREPPYNTTRFYQENARFYANIQRFSQSCNALLVPSGGRGCSIPLPYSRKTTPPSSRVQCQYFEKLGKQKRPYRCLQCGFLPQSGTQIQSLNAFLMHRNGRKSGLQMPTTPFLCTHTIVLSVVPTCTEPTGQPARLFVPNYSTFIL